MPRTITYGELRQFLRDRGFDYKCVEDSHWLFRHAASDTVILLAVHEPDDPVRSHDRQGVRRMLDERGLVPAEDLDRFVAAGQVSPSRAPGSQAS